ncbi:MAG: triose-phosphate isomerase [Burkholderiaceae bacterium]
MPRKLVAGNWKMHGTLPANAKLLAALEQGVLASDCEVAVCVPAPYLAQASQALLGSAVAWGAQDCSAHKQGAFTGEVSAAMLTDFGCRYVIVGHSERRQYHGETSALVAEKMLQVLEAGLSPIVCIGETLAQREAGQTDEVVATQVQAAIDALKRVDEMQWIWRVVIAYEPVWAIGTGKTASPEQAQQVHAAIRRQWQGAFADHAKHLRVLYGGSMKAGNAASLMAQADIDGGLVGGASLVAEEFLAIVAAAKTTAAA